MSSNTNWGHVNIRHDWLQVGIAVAVIASSYYVGKVVYSHVFSAPITFDVTDDTVKIKLMAHEKEIMAMMPAVTTVTRYRIVGGGVPVHSLRRKMIEILSQNPWLTGRLRTSPEYGGMHLYFKPLFPGGTAEKVIDQYFEVVDDFEMDENMPYNELVALLDKLQVKKGNDCVNKENERLFRVTLLRIKGRDEVALVFSLSHVIADGFTFYKLHAMLDKDTPVIAMKVDRSDNFLPELTKLIGKKAVDWVHSPLLLVGLIGCSLFRSKMRTYIVEVDNKWIEEQKKAFAATKAAGSAEAAGVEFVSTNDIITAWHNKICRTDLSLMSINCRKRVPSFTDTMAGNYENSIIYNTPEDSHTPAAVRRSLECFRSASYTMPSPLKTVLWNGSIVTNWSSFYTQCDISSTRRNGVAVSGSASGGANGEAECKCKYLLHFPLVESKDLAVWREGACVFKLDAQRTGMLIATRCITEEMLLTERIGRITSSC